MRILLINQFYKPDTAATGQLLADVAEELAGQGHHVHVICGRSKYDGGKMQETKKDVIDGVHVHRVAGTGFGRGTSVGRMCDWLSFYVLAAWRALRLPRPDVCVTLTTPPFISLIGLMLSKFKGTQSVIWMMDVYPDIAAAYEVMKKRTFLYRILTYINNFTLSNAAAVISLGETMTQRLQSLGALPENLHTVHNWVPGEELLH